MRIDRQSLRAQVCAKLLEWIESGKLRPGERLEGDRLAAELGVSRTPVREALIALEHDGLVTSEPHRGFAIASPNEELVREIYPVIGALEALAVRMTPPSPGNLDEMDRLNASIGSADTGSDESRRLHDRWHRILTGAHQNSALDSQLDRLRRLARLSESERVWEQADRDRSTYAYAQVVDELRRGNAGFAASRLERHWAEMVATPADGGEAADAAGEQRLFGWMNRRRS